MSAIEDQLKKIRREAEEREAKRKAEQAGVGYLDLQTIPVEIEALKLIPEERAKALQACPVQLKARILVLAVYDTASSRVQDLLKELQNKSYTVTVYGASLSGLEQAWSFYQYVTAEAIGITSRLDIEKQTIEGLLQKLTTFVAVAEAVHGFDFKTLPTAKVLEVILAGALANRASDIHFEPEAEAVKVRFRVDGLLHDVLADLARSVYNQLVNRLKLLANLKLNIQSEPQDGRFTVGLQDQEIEIRLSVVPSEFGETVVMRVLDPRMIKIQLPELGFRPDDLKIIQEEINQPNGLILNTGPTGSGKTTTLYAFLQAKLSPEIKIVTIEDPIEYHISGIEQTQVKEDGGYTFANGLRSLMRQDPDVILIGEIRDQETAEIAIQAALTGHLVFSTVHANSASGTIPRLLDLNVKLQSIGPAVNLIIAQRLIRRLCEQCKKAVELTVEQKSNLEKFLATLPTRVDRPLYQSWQLFAPVGCEKCGGVGYRGRVAIFELLRVDPAIEQLITKESGESAIEKMALQQGMVTMQQDGVLKALAGITTFEEVEVVTGKLIF